MENRTCLSYHSIIMFKMFKSHGGLSWVWFVSYMSIMQFLWLKYFKESFSKCYREKFNKHSTLLYPRLSVWIFMVSLNFFYILNIDIVLLCCITIMKKRRVPLLTESENHLLGMLGLCWSIHTTFFMSSKLGSLGTTSWKGGL